MAADLNNKRYHARKNKITISAVIEIPQRLGFPSFLLLPWCDTEQVDLWIIPMSILRTEYSGCDDIRWGVLSPSIHCNKPAVTGARQGSCNCSIVVDRVNYSRRLISTL